MNEISLKDFDLVYSRRLYALLLLPIFLVIVHFTLTSHSRRRLVASTSIRAVLSAILVIALAGPGFWRSSADFRVVFAVDRSDSIGEEGRAKIDNFLQRALLNRGETNLSMFAFAAEPGAVSGARLSELKPPQDLSDTDIGAAIEKAAAITPSGSGSRLILLTDGNETRGKAELAAKRYSIPIYAVPLPQRDEPNVQLAEVIAPLQAREGEPFKLEIMIHSTCEDTGTLAIFLNDVRAQHVGGAITVIPGDNRFPFMLTATGEGKYIKIRAELQGFTRDKDRSDNAARALVYCLGRPKVLIVTGDDPRDCQPLVEALKSQQFNVDPPRGPEGLPRGVAECQPYDLIILSNLDLTKPGVNQQKLHSLRTYVRDLGGGLLVIGGENSYGPGGYRHSVLEDVLPVSCDVRDGRERPTLALMLVIDKSGSMQENDKIGSARVAALAAAKSLGPNDQIGIIVFEDEARRLSPLDRAPTQQARLPNLLQGIIPGGGTHIRPALELAVEDLRAVGAAARHKHIILLTDGQDNLTVSSKKPDYMRLCEDALGSGIRISTVAVGSEKETDRDLLREIANRGQGKFYFTEDATEIPRIVLKAANEVGRRSIKEGFFDAQPTRAIPEFRNLRLESAPQLEGYVMTRLAPGAEEALHTPDGDPLLAWRNFGLGKCTAFTSDARNRWARQWIDDPSLFNLFWAQVCRRTARSPEPLGVEVQVMRERRKATVILDNVDLDGRFVNGSKIDLLWGDWDPARGQTTVESVTMNQVAPGRYQASFPLQRGAGEYFLQLRGRSGDVESLRLSRGLVVGFDEELRLRPTNTRLLRDLSETTGGCYDPSPEEVFEQPNRLGRKRISLVPYFLGFAVLLLVVDVSVRRLPAKS